MRAIQHFPTLLADEQDDEPEILHPLLLQLLREPLHCIRDLPLCSAQLPLLPLPQVQQVPDDTGCESCAS